MKIGIVIGRIGDIDGVALETLKWIEVLQRLGHEMFILSGWFKKDVIAPERQTQYQPLSFFSPECEWEQNRAFFYPPDDGDELLQHLDAQANEVATVIFRWVLQNQLDALLIENASALPCHLSMGMGIGRAVAHLGLPTVTHDHDFAWERGARYLSPFHEITAIVETTFPLRLEGVRHAVINSAASDAFRDRYGIEATFVPNVMDFEHPYALPDEYNAEFLREIGLDPESDIPLFQITRIVERKGIDVAVDLVSRFSDPRVKLVITGSAADDQRKGYYHRLIELIDERDLHGRVIFAHHKVLSDRTTTHDGAKIYSLSDAYAHATACTYFSTYEGFGNAFVEAVLAKKPIFVNNYQPVYWTDIGSKGFETVQLEDNVLTDEAVAVMDEIVHDPKRQQEIAEHNFALGREHFSFAVLQDLLETLFAF